MLWRDLFHYPAAEAELLEVLALQRSLRQDKREIAKTLGDLGELWTFMDQHPRAEATLLEALELLKDTAPDEVPREHCYLGNLELRRGNARGALEHFEEGLRRNAQVKHGRAVNWAFLQYGKARALYALLQDRATIQHVDELLAASTPAQPYPRQLALKYRGLSQLRLGHITSGQADLWRAADLTFINGALLAYGVGTALGELALHLIEDHSCRASACALGERFLQHAQPLVDHLFTPELSTRLRSTVLLETPAAEATALIRRCISLFPY